MKLSDIAECVDLDVEEVEKIIQFLSKNRYKVNMWIVSQEKRI